jgi:hypothetical protein
VTVWGTEEAIVRAGHSAAVGAVLMGLLVVGGASFDQGAGSARNKKDQWAQLGHELASTFHNPAASITLIFKFLFDHRRG